ncbi:MAG: DsrE family protein [Nitrososphaeria archaeon]|nr:DsrE family protein [Conexivisphaerales archaeon]
MVNKVFVICTSGREDINNTNMAVSFALGARKNAGAEVSFMFLGRGVENLLKDAATAQQMENMIKSMEDAGIDVTYCGVSLKNLGFSKDMVMQIASEVMGGVQTVKKIEEGYAVVTF